MARRPKSTDADRARGEDQPQPPPAAESESTFVSPKGHKYRVIHTREVDDYQRPDEKAGDDAARPRPSTPPPPSSKD
jgi:hypothetical protein